MNQLKKILFFFSFTNKIKTFFFIISTFLLSMLEFIGLSLIIILLSVALKVEAFTTNDTLKNFSLVIFQNFSQNLIILIIFLTFLFKTVFYIFLTNWKIKFMNEILIKISKKLLNVYMKSEKEIFYKKNSGEFLTNISNETTKVIKALTASVDFLFDIFLFITALILLSFVSIKPTIIIFCFLLLFTVIYFFFLKKYLIYVSEKNINLTADSFKFLVECFRGYLEIFMNNKQNFFINRFLNKTISILRFKRYEGIIKILPRSLLDLTVVAILLYIIFNFSNEKKDLNLIFFNLTIYASVFFRLYPSIGKTISNIQLIISFNPSINLIKNELDKSFKKLISGKNRILAKNFFIEKIEIKNLSFLYDEKKLVLKNFSKIIYKNSIIGIVGKTGSGKTTLIHLLSGIIAPSKGEIVINDNIKLEDLKNWTDKVAYVSQKPFIIDSTIRDNVLLGEDVKDYNQKKLNEAYALSGLEEMINKLDNKDLTFVGDSGNFISGGQLQRIGIARALYKQANIFLFDEITSNLDDKISASILSNIKNLKNNRLIFLISHDKAILDYCDDTINL